jgi:hypothetical protein
MEMYDAIFSEEFGLNDQISRQIFENIPKDGPLVLIKDRKGNCWPSDSTQFSKSEISKQFLLELEGKIDDGQEPLVAQSNGCTIVANQLATDRTNCGYTFVILDNCSQESALVNIDLIEMLLSQIEIIAKLIEKNTLLYEFRMRNFPGSPEYIKTEVSVN